MALSYEPDGTPSGRNYFLYAYCLMSNHIHLLIREREDKIGMAIKRIASSYVYYYNRKYGRDGHLACDNNLRRDILKKLKGIGASHRQQERLTGIGRGVIQKI